MNYIYRALWSIVNVDEIVDDVDQEENVVVVKVDDDEIRKLWKFFHHEFCVTGKIGDNETKEELENLQKLREILDLATWSAATPPICGAKQELQDILVLIALGDISGQAYTFLNLCERFHQLFAMTVSEVLSRSLVLKPPTPMHFQVPSFEKFHKTVATYIQTIDQLQPNWKKQVYFVQFLNYLTNHREMYVWKFPNLHQAVMKKLIECENLAGFSLAWHRQILTRPPP